MTTERNDRARALVSSAFSATKSAFIVAIAATITMTAAAVANAGRDAELVTECGQIVERHGVLAQDLDCTAETFAAVRLHRRATLDLNGFSITGTPAAVPNDCWLGACPDEADLVRCVRRCTVEGPGTLTGGRYGIVAAATLGGSPFQKRSRGRITAIDVTISDTGVAVLVPEGRVIAAGVELRNNFVGISSTTTLVSDSEVSGTALFGILAGRARVQRSSLIGAGSRDIFTQGRPRIDAASECDRSGAGSTRHGVGAIVDTWGICRLD